MSVKEIYYSPISHIDWFNNCNCDLREFFNNSDKRQICDFLYENGYVAKLFGNKSTVSAISILNNPYGDAISTIIKKEDEWFYIFYKHSKRYFKCDQIDGLIDNLGRYLFGI